jgi:hypothetical protein
MEDFFFLLEGFLLAGGLLGPAFLVGCLGTGGLLIV